MSLAYSGVTMLRITRQVGGSRGGIHLRLDGQVSGPWVEELRRACDEVLSQSRGDALVLDLANVSFVDAEGLALFRALAARESRLANCSPFVREQLKETANACR
jgi:anti-anti-sigma regulatory factor